MGEGDAPRMRAVEEIVCKSLQGVSSLKHQHGSPARAERKVSSLLLTDQDVHAFRAGLV